MSWTNQKKLLPPSCRCMESSLLGKTRQNLLTKAPPLPSNYISFVRRTVSRLFPKAWDSKYEDYVARAAPNISGTLQTPRARGGALAELGQVRASFEEGRGFYLHGGHASFLEKALGQAELSEKIEAELIVVQSAGKPRPLTKFDAEAFVLQPLHKLIYDQLSKNKWLLRGDVENGKLANAGFHVGTEKVSGDYRSATDNLPIEVAEEILSALRARSISVPDQVWEYARRALRPTIHSAGADPFVPVKGQMMGSYLSFPLLCLQNYLAFRYAFRDEEDKKGRLSRPVLINGDDILFEGDDSDFVKWLDIVKRVGLEVERTKTSVGTWGSINSTVINPDLNIVRTLKFGLLKTPEYPHGLGASFRKWVNSVARSRRFAAGVSFLNEHRKTIHKSMVSVTEMGLSGRLVVNCLKRLGLWDRENAVTHYGDLKLPPAPMKHGVLMDLVQVEEREVCEDLERVNAREMAAEKWRLADQAEEIAGVGKKWWRDHSKNITELVATHDSRPESYYRLSPVCLDVRTYARLIAKREVVKELTRPVLRRVYETWWEQQSEEYVYYSLFHLTGLGLPPYHALCHTEDST
jgi:hypothetical protein